jgi:hypothetical protein
VSDNCPIHGEHDGAPTTPPMTCPLAHYTPGHGVHRCGLRLVPLADAVAVALRYRDGWMRRGDSWGKGSATPPPDDRTIEPMTAGELVVSDAVLAALAPSPSEEQA